MRRDIGRVGNCALITLLCCVMGKMDGMVAPDSCSADVARYGRHRGVTLSPMSNTNNRSFPVTPALLCCLIFSKLIGICAAKLCPHAIKETHMFTENMFNDKHQSSPNEHSSH